MACIKGYDTITGKPCVDTMKQDKKYVGEFESGPHKFYQDRLKFTASGRPYQREFTQEEAIRMPGYLANSFDAFYRDVPTERKKGGSVIKGKSLRRSRTHKK